MKRLLRTGLSMLAALLAAAGGTAALADEKAATTKTADQQKTARLIYKDEPRRTMTVFYPDDWKATDRRPALVIFRCNIPEQEAHFRKRGMVVIKPLLAPVNSGQLPGLSLEEIAKLPRPRHQVEDAKSAIRFIRSRAAQLGVDPDKIVATGTSGGGDLALLSHLNRTFEDANADRSVSASPDALVLYCPAFDGIDIWFVKTDAFMTKVKADAPAFVPHLSRFVRGTEDDYVTPLNHRTTLIEHAAVIGKANKIDEAQIKGMQDALMMFNARDWQLLHPFEDALKMSASRMLTKEPLPPTLILLWDRDHLATYQDAFVKKAKQTGQQFELKVYKNGGHSFMMQPAFSGPSTADVDAFLTQRGFLPFIRP